MARKKVKSKRLHTGWDIRGRPFSETEYKRSRLYKSFRKPYPTYLGVFAETYNREKRRKKKRRR